MTMILVTGATGTTGSGVLRLLGEKGVPARALARNPDKVAPGFEVVRGDYEDPASLRQALSGVEGVYLVSSPGPHIPSHDLALVEAATEAGVRKIVKLSAFGIGEVGLETTSGWHRPGEDAIRASGMAWTFLRPPTFASNSLAWLPQIAAEEPIPNRFGTGAIGVIDPRDISAVAVAALLTDDHDGQAYTLTGPELVTMADMVAQLGEVLGRPLRIFDEPDSAVRAEFAKMGMSDEYVDVVMKGWEYVRNGGLAVLTDDVERALGRPATSFKEWAADHAASFRQAVGA
jgi:uncharacterized protein YbjT (DUF2867 family)